MDPQTRYKKERQTSKQNRTRHILETAETVFTVKGIEKTTMQDIANAANIGIATLFRYFPRKEKLIVAAATKRLEPMLSRFEEIAELEATCFEKLDRLFEAFIHDNNALDIKLMVDFENYASHSSEPLEDIQAYNALHRQISAQYSRIIQQGMEDGSIRSDLQVRETLTTIMNTFGLFSKSLVIQSNILLLESDLEFEKQLRVLKDILLGYVKA
ncbi:TetR/AcrR family transcriptional regulator [Paenibacillus sp. NPDC058071]|uniref:TetR/AcrR family transcriptional regulator n=1 Tax=Paenibacillus sp. NPDC058071 TaxID=3346326 RepID=UPI0036DC54DB